MINSLPQILIYVLLATSSPSSRKRHKQRSPTNNNKKSATSKDSSSSTTTKTNKGRYRYNHHGKKKRDSHNKKKEEKGGGRGKSDISSTIPTELLPSVTTRAGKLIQPSPTLPFYFTCRHTYEQTLVDEINRHFSQNTDSDDNSGVIPKILFPGLVQVLQQQQQQQQEIPTYYDPVYALQSIPSAHCVEGDSIKILANEILDAVLVAEKDDKKGLLRRAPRGSLSIHPLVPGQCKGQTKPIYLERCKKICQEIANGMKKGYPTARNRPQQSNDTEEEGVEEKEKWILQVMLLTPTKAIASLEQCQQAQSDSTPTMEVMWPNYIHPLGLANCDIEEKMPSSAYRKLMEAFECMRIKPTPNSSLVVDLGASPGGWTSVIDKFFPSTHIIAVDRADLDPKLMKKKDKITVVKGDAFTFQPPPIPPTMDPNKTNDSSITTWMISDIISYPDRITELLGNWCSNKWASHMIVTMKFQQEADFDELDRAIETVTKHGYHCRVKHFFNNKNEVTIMVSSPRGNLPSSSLSASILQHDSLGSSMYTKTI